MQAVLVASTAVLEGEHPESAVFGELRRERRFWRFWRGGGGVGKPHLVGKGYGFILFTAVKSPQRGDYRGVKEWVKKGVYSRGDARGEGGNMRENHQGGRKGDDIRKVVLKK